MDFSLSLFLLRFVGLKAQQIFYKSRVNQKGGNRLRFFNLTCFSYLIEMFYIIVMFNENVEHDLLTIIAVGIEKIFIEI